MNQGQFKEFVSHMCLADTVVASCSSTQEMAGSSPFTGITNNFVTEFSEFRENIYGKLNYHNCQNISLSLLM